MIVVHWWLEIITSCQPACMMLPCCLATCEAAGVLLYPLHVENVVQQREGQVEVDAAAAAANAAFACNLCQVQVLMLHRARGSSNTPVAKSCILPVSNQQPTVAAGCQGCAEVFTSCCGCILPFCRM